MKRFLTALLTVLMVISLGACSQPKTDAFKGGTFTGTAKGFAGDITVEVTIDDNKTITDVKVVEHTETEDIGGKALETLAKDVVALNSSQVDTVTTATVTSLAFIEAVNAAITAAGLNPEDFVPGEVGAVEKTDETLDVDIVIIGAGGAGMAAGITAAQEGKSVIIVEKAPMVGGNTSRATGGMNAAGSHYQEEAGIEDSVELFVEDTIKGGHGLNNPDLVQVMAENSADAIVWLDSIGAELSNVGKAGGASVNRAHRPVDENGKILSVGTYLVSKLEEACVDNGVEILLETQATEILMEDGVAVGIIANSPTVNYTINAGAVIVASGGFGGNLEMVAELKPELEGYVSTNAPTLTGDGIKMAEAVGAATVDMEQIQIHPTVVQANGALITESLRGDGAILLNAEGKRFIDETQTRDVVSANVIAQTDSYAWLIVNQAMFDDSTVVQKYVDQEYLIAAEDVAALAELIGADEAVIQESLDAWNTAIETQNDAECGREGLDTIAYNVSEGSYYAVKIAPGIHHTMGGIMINTNAEVIDTEGNVIPGLYAAGEVTGGVHGGNRLGANAVTDIIVYGRIAAQQAAQYIE
ncbi:MAG: flavocytochrome c [Erysipelotrichaceae bacterium]|nr:flavocytochrome c [Erysipelotrichaceae bacterium]